MISCPKGTPNSVKILKPLIKHVENVDFLSKRVAKIAQEAEVEVQVHARPRWRCEAEAEVQILIKGRGSGPPRIRLLIKGGSGDPDFHLRLGPPPVRQVVRPPQKCNVQFCPMSNKMGLQTVRIPQSGRSEISQVNCRLKIHGWWRRSCLSASQVDHFLDS